MTVLLYSHCVTVDVGLTCFTLMQFNLICLTRVALKTFSVYCWSDQVKTNVEIVVTIPKYSFMNMYMRCFELQANENKNKNATFSKYSTGK